MRRFPTLALLALLGGAGCDEDLARGGDAAPDLGATDAPIHDGPPASADTRPSPRDGPAAADGPAGLPDAPRPPGDGAAPQQTKIIAPAAGAPLQEGTTVTLEGQGPGTLSWSYDANSDGKGEIAIGSGASVSFAVPAGINPPRVLTLFLSSSADKIQQQHDITTGPAPDGGSPPGTCTGFVEQAGLVVMEVESAPLAGSWSKRTGVAGFTGSAYYEWKHGDTSTSTDAAGSGVLSYPVCVGKTGRYQLHIHSAAPHSTEHNDVWVRFPDTGAVRSKSGADTSLGTGWFKVYENKGGDTWQWQTTTKDHDAHDIFFDVASPRGLRVELSGRSTQFKVDRIVLRHTSVSTSDALKSTNPESSTR